MEAFTVSEKSGNLISPKGRLDWVFLLTPNPKAKSKKDGRLKYTTSFLMPGTSDFSAAMTAINAAGEDFFGKKWEDENFRKAARKPFLKAEEHGYGDEFKGWVLIRPSSVDAPQLVDPANKLVTEPRDVYSGRWARLSLNAYGYDVDGNRGVSLGLKNVQLLEHDNPLSGRAKATDEFAPVAVAEVGGSTGAASVFD